MPDIPLTPDASWTDAWARRPAGADANAPESWIGWAEALTESHRGGLLEMSGAGRLQIHTPHPVLGVNPFWALSALLGRSAPQLTGALLRQSNAGTLSESPLLTAWTEDNARWGPRSLAIHPDLATSLHAVPLRDLSFYEHFARQHAAHLLFLLVRAIESAAEPITPVRQAWITEAITTAGSLLSGHDSSPNDNGQHERATSRYQGAPTLPGIEWQRLIALARLQGLVESRVLSGPWVEVFDTVISRLPADLSPTAALRGTAPAAYACRTHLRSFRAFFVSRQRWSPPVERALIVWSVIEPEVAPFWRRDVEGGVQLLQDARVTWQPETIGPVLRRGTQNTGTTQSPVLLLHRRPAVAAVAWWVTQVAAQLSPSDLAVVLKVVGLMFVAYGPTIAEVNEMLTTLTKTPHAHASILAWACRPAAAHGISPTDWSHVRRLVVETVCPVEPGHVAALLADEDRGVREAVIRHIGRAKEKLISTAPVVAPPRLGA